MYVQKICLTQGVFMSKNMLFVAMFAAVSVVASEPSVTTTTTTTTTSTPAPVVTLAELQSAQEAAKAAAELAAKAAKDAAAKLAEAAKAVADKTEEVKQAAIDAAKVLADNTKAAAKVAAQVAKDAAQAYNDAKAGKTPVVKSAPVDLAANGEATPATTSEEAKTSYMQAIKTAFVNAKNGVVSQATKEGQFLKGLVTAPITTIKEHRMRAAVTAAVVAATAYGIYWYCNQEEVDEDLL